MGEKKQIPWFSSWQPQTDKKNKFLTEVFTKYITVLGKNVAIVFFFFFFLPVAKPERKKQGFIK